MGKARSTEEQLLLNSVQEYTMGEVQFGGGGRGQFVSVVANPGDGDYELFGRGASRVAALEALIVELRALFASKQPEPKPEPKAKSDRLTVEDGLALMAKAFGEFDVAEATDDRDPGVTWKDGQIVAFVPCVGECMAGQSDLCDCRCAGENHGIAKASLIDALLMGGLSVQSFNAQRRPTIYGKKSCACGCGGETLRRFIPGHDARYHARQNLLKFATATNLRPAGSEDLFGSDDPAATLAGLPEVEAAIRDEYKQAMKATRAAARRSKINEVVTPASE